LKSKLPNTSKPDRPQHDRPSTCAIAQQYASRVLTFRAGVMGPSDQCCRLLGKNKDALKHFETKEIANCECRCSHIVVSIYRCCGGSSCVSRVIQNFYCIISRNIPCLAECDVTHSYSLCLVTHTVLFYVTVYNLCFVSLLQVRSLVMPYIYARYVRYALR